MANTFRTDAIVLRKLRYGEADSILHLYTREQGRMSAIAKGVRRSRSRFGGRLEPFFRLELMLYEGRGDLATVTSAATNEAYPRLRGRACSIAAAAMAGDFVLRLLDGRERNEPAFNLLANLLALLDADPDGARREVALAFRAKLLLAAGFSPELGSCAHCGSREELVAFSPAAGGVVCRDCREAGDFEFGSEAYEFMSDAVGSPLAEAPAAGADALRQADRAIAETLAYHANVRVRQLA